LLINLCGQPKSGKTVSACTFPKPLVYCDFEQGFTSVLHATDASGQPIVHDADQIQVERLSTSAPVLEFNAVTDPKRNAAAPRSTHNAMPLLQRYNSLFAGFDQNGYPKTLVIDSFTEVLRLMKNAVLAQNNRTALAIADYGTLEFMVTQQFIANLRYYSDKIPWIILISHTIFEKDDLTGQVFELPVASSRTQSKQISALFDEVWYQVADYGKYAWRTRPYKYFTVAGSRLNLPEQISPPTYAELAKHVSKLNA